TPRHTAFYIQPTFSIRNITTRADVITNMWLEVQRIHPDRSQDHNVPPKRQSLKFFWQYITKFKWDNKSRDEAFDTIISDSVPLPVAFASPQSPMACFVRHASDTWWQADASYKITLYAQSALSKKPLYASVRVKLEKSKIRELESHISEEWYQVFY